MTNLKPCPFCGRTPVIEDCGENRYFIRCKCGIAQDKLYWQKCDAVRRWNTRKEQTEITEEAVKEYCRKRGIINILTYSEFERRQNENNY